MLEDESLSGRDVGDAVSDAADANRRDDGAGAPAGNPAGADPTVPSGDPTDRGQNPPSGNPGYGQTPPSGDPAGDDEEPPSGNPTGYGQDNHPSGRP